MSYTHLLYHIVFRPKSSESVINTEHENDLYRYIWGVVKQKNCILYRIGGMPDHIHLLVQLRPNITLADFVRDLKVATNIFMTGHKDMFPFFNGWGREYCALTCSAKDKNSVVDYIKNQKIHHRVMSFKEELAEIFKAIGNEANLKHFFDD